MAGRDCPADCVETSAGCDKRLKLRGDFAKQGRGRRARPAVDKPALRKAEARVSDIFQEVDEEVRREQLKKLWDRYGHFAIAACVVVVLAVAGWRGYQWWEAKQAGIASAKFDAAAQLADEGKFAEAQVAFADVAKGGTAGYRNLARLREAAALAEKDAKAAVAAYDALAADAALGQPLQDLAVIRAGLLLADTAPLADMTRRLEPATAATAPFRHTARELLALSAWRNGDMAAVKRWSETISNDLETPPDVRMRVEVLATLAAGGKS
jgi:hypothetical protein